MNTDEANSKPVNAGTTLAVAAAGPLLVLIAFTVPLTTLMSTASALGAAALGQLALFGLAEGASLVRLLPALLVAGAAYGLLNAALGRQAVASVPADRSAMGSGANNTARYLGSAVGLALVTVLVTHAGPGAGRAGLLAGWNLAVLLTVGWSLLGALVLFLARERPTQVQLDDPSSCVSLGPGRLPNVDAR